MFLHPIVATPASLLSIEIQLAALVLTMPYFENFGTGVTNLVASYAGIHNANQAHQFQATSLPAHLP